MSARPRAPPPARHRADERKRETVRARPPSNFRRAEARPAGMGARMTLSRVTLASEHRFVTRTGGLSGQLQTSLGEAFAIERELGGGGMSRVFLARERA